MYSSTEAPGAFGEKNVIDGSNRWKIVERFGIFGLVGSEPNKGEQIMHIKTIKMYQIVQILPARLSVQTSALAQSLCSHAKERKAVAVRTSPGQETQNEETNKIAAVVTQNTMKKIHPPPSKKRTRVPGPFIPAYLIELEPKMHPNPLPVPSKPLHNSHGKT